MAYFGRFPMTVYDMKGNNVHKLLPDILRRVKLRSSIRAGMFIFDNYDVYRVVDRLPGISSNRLGYNVIESYTT